MKQVIAWGMVATMLAGCTASTRPQLSSVNSGLSNPQQVVTPVAIPNPPQPAVGSLWVPGSKQFFKDSRAHQVGDIVTVLVSEEATATIEGKTDASRTHSQSAGVSVLPFVSGQLLTRGIDLATNGLADTDSNRDFQGDASTDRKDSLQASVAAVVTQVLPNGLLVIQGQREVLVNYEKQILQLTGIVRPEDISAQNSVPSSKIAEARIAYAGKGMIDDAQTPQYGVKWIDKVLPF